MLKIKPGSLLINPQLGFDTREPGNQILESFAEIVEDGKKVGRISFAITLFAPYKKIDSTNYRAIATELIQYEERRKKKANTPCS